uniref:Glycerophosphocholine acyltransferase 1 n=1 Tax=Aplanochytrium stocchinoi TaxID=215587 RepID=A0A7S3PHU6_9STRA|mmetsp:Transcript_17579/g.22392  ORF Transcript_17579/g.22392 Transcript_17579/m.22392 type:complete len:352 (+) Transcript_17579:129-1184(+)
MESRNKYNIDHARMSRRVWEYMDGDLNRVEKNQNADEKPRNHFLDKLWYFCVVYGVICFTYLMTDDTGRGYLPLFYVVLLPILLVHRYFQYKRRKWQYYMLDFCYVANLLLFLYIMAFQQSGFLFLVCFGLANSTLAFAIPLLHNALVFHSIDKVTSIFIHAMPMCVVFTIRWFPEQSSRIWYAEFKPENLEEELATLLQLNLTESKLPDKVLYIAFPAATTLLVFLGQMMEFILLHFIATHPKVKRCIRFHEDKDHMNLFRLVTNTHGDKSAFLSAYPFLSYTLGMTFGGLFASAPVGLFYIYFNINTAFVVIILFSALWSGSRFYVKVFGLYHMDQENQVEGQVKVQFC